MVLKRGRRKPIPEAHPGFNYEMTLPGEPMIYSVKYACGSRALHGQLFRNRMFAPMIRCRFRSYLNSNVPIVLLIKFYVQPLRDGICNLKQLEAENVPATSSFEMAEYLLSFQEMLFPSHIHSYKQIVKIECEKFYSNIPRTVFKFMRYEHYVHFRDTNTLHAQAKSERTINALGCLQSQQPEHGDITHHGKISYETRDPYDGSSQCSLPLPDPDPEVHKAPKKKKANRSVSRKKT